MDSGSLPDRVHLHSFPTSETHGLVAPPCVVVGVNFRGNNAYLFTMLHRLAAISRRSTRLTRSRLRASLIASQLPLLRYIASQLLQYRSLRNITRSRLRASLIASQLPLLRSLGRAPAIALAPAIPLTPAILPQCYSLPPSRPSYCVAAPAIALTRESSRYCTRSRNTSNSRNTPASAPVLLRRSVVTLGAFMLAAPGGVTLLLTLILRRRRRRHFSLVSSMSLTVYGVSPTGCFRGVHAGCTFKA
jgi:hypothetical protein